VSIIFRLLLRLLRRYCQLLRRYCQLLRRYCQLLRRYCQLLRRYCQLLRLRLHCHHDYDDDGGFYVRTRTANLTSLS
jgi:hypothetical protein